MRGRRLAVGPGDADDPQRLARPSGKGLANLSVGFSSVAHQALWHIDCQLALGHDGSRSASQRLAHELVTVRFASAQRDEDIARATDARIGRATRHADVVSPLEFGASQQAGQTQRFVDRNRLRHAASGLRAVRMKLFAMSPLFRERVPKWRRDFGDFRQPVKTGLNGLHAAASYGQMILATK